MMSKRRHSKAFDQRELINIKTSDNDEEIKAHALVVRLYSAVAHDLPAGSEEWDVSSLRSEMDGQPFTREVIVSWLNCAYQAAYAADFEHQPVNIASSVSGLCKLLSFADAVDSTMSVYRTCMPALRDLTLHATLGQQQLRLDMCKAYFMRQQQLRYLDERRYSTVDDTVVSDAEEKQFSDQVAQQAEQLLYLAYKLQLGPLIEHMHTFVANNTCFRKSLLYERLGIIFSDRIRDQAVGSNQLGEKMWMDSILSGSSTGPLLAKSKPGEQLLEPISLTEQQKKPITFTAKLLHDMRGIPAGAVVPIELDLFGTGIMRVNGGGGAGTWFS